MAEDWTTAGAAKEFVASIRTSRKTGPKFRNVMTPFTLDSGKMFSNRSAFTINPQNRFSGANYVLTIEGPALFQSPGIRRVQRFAQFCLRGALFRPRGAGFGPIRYAVKF
jgi:hypothetical protein